MNAQQQLPRRDRRRQQQKRQQLQPQVLRRQYSRAFFNSNLQGAARGNEPTQLYHNPRNGHQVHEQIPRPPPVNRSSHRAPVQNGLSNGNFNSVAPLAGPARNQPPHANRVHHHHHHDHDHARQPVQQNAQQQALPQYVFYPTVQYGHDGQYYVLPYGQVPQNYAHQMATQWALQGGQQPYYGPFYGQHHHHQWTQHHQQHHYLPVQCHDDRLMCYNCGRVQVIQVDESIETDPIEIDEQDQ